MSSTERGSSTTNGAAAGVEKQTERDSPGFSLAAVGGSALILMGATFVVQAIGIIRELYLAARLGVSADLDALIIGISLPSALSGVLVSGARVALVPAYMHTAMRLGTVGATRLAGAVLAAVALAGAMVTAILYLFAPAIVAITGPGLAAEQRASAAGYMQTVAPIALFGAVTGVLFAVCQAERRFLLIAISLIAGPSVTLATMILLWDQQGIDALATGVLVGTVTAIAILSVVMVRIGVFPRLPRTIFGLGLRAFVRHAVPLTVSSAILQLNPIIDRAVASVVAPGAVSSLRFADSMLRAPIAAIAPALGSAAYPAFVNSATDSRGSDLGRAASRTLRVVLCLFIPVALLAAAVAPVAVSVLYGRGAFTEDDVAMVASVLVAFSPLIFILVADEVLTTALNARRSGVVLLAAGAANVVLNTFFDVVLGFSLGVVGVALSSTLTLAIVVGWKATRLANREPDFSLGAIGITALRAALAAAPASIIIGWVCWTAYTAQGPVVGLAALALSAALGAASYLTLSLLIGLREPLDVTGHLMARLRARMRPSQGTA